MNLLITILELYLVEGKRKMVKRRAKIVEGFWKSGWKKKKKKKKKG